MKVFNDNFRFYKGENWINLSNLPRQKTKVREQIKWDNSIGYSVEYYFEGENGRIEIIDCYKENNQKYLEVKCKNKKVNILPANFKNCEIKKIVTDGYNHKLGFVINGCKVIDKRLNPRSKEREYKMLCLETGHTFYRRESRIDNGAPSPYVSGKYVYEGNWLFNEKNILPFLKNVNDAKKYTKFSRREIICICPNCKTEKSVSVNNLVQQGFFCHICSTNIPYPEKLMIALLNENDIAYDYQKIFQELKPKRFDFYLPNYNLVIETHGKQHYNENDAWYKKTNESDIIKKDYCKKNNIKYIEVDCSISDYDFILKNINNTELRHLLTNTNKEKLINKIKELEQLKEVDEIIDFYVEGKGLSYISKEVGITKWKVKGLLKRLGYIKS
jgi:hypothetical protein